jgi:hypothetical protein
MRTSLLLPFLTIALFGAAAPTARAEDPPSPAGQEPATPNANDEAAKWLELVKSQIGKQDEAGAKESIARLVAVWKDKDVLPDTKKAVPDLLERYAKDDRMVVAVVAAVDAMAELGPEAGGKALREVLERALKAKQPSVDVYGAALRALKKLADPSKPTIDLLVDLLKRKENDVVGKAADAMAGYKEAPMKVRKDLVEEVLKLGESVYQGSRDGKDAALVAKWGEIQGGVMAALRTLTGQNFPDPTAARKWFNDHKKDAKAWN